MTDDETKVKAGKAPLWTAEEYHGIHYSGAKKLADSAVAPLVAQARGYEEKSSEAEAREFAKDKSRNTTPTALTRLLTQMTRDGNDFLALPWFSLSNVYEDGSASRASSWQVRPRTPITPRGGGKPPKYQLLDGHQSVLDLHPATPFAWSREAPNVLITEGVPKGDAALTALLLHAGVTADDLAARPDLDTTAAREVLAELLERVQHKERVTIVSLVGVHNWRGNKEWSSLSLKDKEVLLAFDGDLRENRQVWGAAEAMYEMIESKGGAPRLVDLGGPNAEQMALTAGWNVGHDKVGLDDFLSHIGTWDDILDAGIITSHLPPQPSAKEDGHVRAGTWRVSSEGTSVEVFEVKKVDGFDYSEWHREKVCLGGRIVEIQSLRTPVNTDIPNGKADDSTVVASGDGKVVVEVSFADAVHGERKDYKVTGPLELLDTVPAEWYRRRAIIDPHIRRHPEWPPRGKDGEGWLSAVKANRAEEQILKQGWDVMGWVPTEEGHPVFVIGENQSIGASEEDEANNRPGVSEETMPMAFSYGVNDTFRQLPKEQYRKQVAEDARWVLDAFIENSPWENKDKAVGPILLAAALRPTAPTQTGVSLYLSGAPGSGKSWCASFMMGFWQSRPAVWSHTKLPGSAKDTEAATNDARARTPIYVIDDLAPNNSRQEAERQQSMVENSIRTTGNGAGKRRAKLDGGQMSAANPRALLVVTAENQLDTLSIRQRAIDIHFERGSVDNERAKKIADAMKSPENRMARLTAAMIRFWTNVDIDDTLLPLARLQDSDLEDLNLSTWAGKHQLARRIREAAAKQMQEVLQDQYGISESESSRRAGWFSELYFTLDVLRALAEWAGVGLDEPVMRRLEGSAYEETSVAGSMVAYAARDLDEFRARSNSRALLEALRNAMSGGYGFLDNPAMPGRPPFVGHPEDNTLNQMCGWSYDPAREQWMPKGSRLGSVGQPDGAEPDEWVALFDAQNAFTVASQRYPNLIPPGQKANASWQQVWVDENGGLVSARYKKPARDTSTKVRLSGMRQRGVPVRLNVLLDTDGADGINLDVRHPEEREQSGPASEVPEQHAPADPQPKVGQPAAT